MTRTTRTVKVTTPALERSLPSGLVTVGPVVEADLVAHGDEDEARAELKMFLAEHLAKPPAGQAARYVFPEGVRVEAIEVALDPGAKVRPRPPRMVAVTCVIVPHGGAQWVFAPMLDASFYVERKEDLYEVARRELARVAAARELDGDEWRRVLPPLEPRSSTSRCTSGWWRRRGPTRRGWPRKSGARPACRNAA